ncbi:MAG TPA: MMPL family transporter [Actinomycetes bacterium]|nr:MMPL family transporter [Actinomycetes bacterium]
MMRGRFAGFGFQGLGRVMYRRRRWVLGATVAFVAFAGVWGTAVFGELSGGGFDDPASEASRAESALDTDLQRQAADVVVVYTAPDGSGLQVSDPAFRREVTGTLAQLPKDAVTGVTTYWSSHGSPAFASEDGRSTYAIVQLAGADDEARETTYTAIADDLVAPTLETLRGGTVPISADINTQVTEDISFAETISMPVLLILLVVVFGSLAAASLPLAIGAIAILGAFTLLRVLTLFGDVSIFAVNIVTMLGLGLAIDYGLFMVSRFREELHAGHDIETAVARTTATAGRTVAFSGITVVVALASLLFFPLNFLRSMGFGGMAAVFVAMVAALTTLPALLGILGHRVDALRIPTPWRSAAPGISNPDSGAWARLARAVMKRPVAVIAGTVALLVVLGLPFLQIDFGGVDSRVLPSGTESRTASATIQQDFPGGSAEAPIDVVIRGAHPSGVASFTAAVDRLPEVAGVDVVDGSAETTHVQVAYEGGVNDDTTLDLVSQIRQLPVPPGADVLVGGDSALLVDRLDGIGSLLPWVGLYLVGAMFVLLFLAFGSVVLPIKALVMNVLSLSATFGVLVWGYQNGHLSGVFDFTSTGYLEATQPILIFAMAFGLSMDYEVFLLSRMREEWDATGDNERAVARGLQRTGRIITSAALLFVVVVGAFSFSGISFISMIGVGLAVAVIIDATIVRALLVPATMRLLGRWNWYAPAPLARFWERFGVSESSSPIELPGSGEHGDVDAELDADDAAPEGSRSTVRV